MGKRVGEIERKTERYKERGGGREREKESMIRERERESMIRERERESGVRERREEKVGEERGKERERLSGKENCRVGEIESEDRKREKEGDNSSDNKEIFGGDR
jgi:hypothetical protein